MINLYLTDLNNPTELRINSLTKVKTDGTHNAVIVIRQDSATSYMQNTYTKYQLQKISIIPVSAINIKYKYTLDWSDGTLYKKMYEVDHMGAAASPDFLENLLSWYGYIAENPLRLTIQSETEQEFYVHIIAYEHNKGIL